VLAVELIISNNKELMKGLDRAVNVTVTFGNGQSHPHRRGSHPQNGAGQQSRAGDFSGCGGVSSGW